MGAVPGRSTRIVRGHEGKRREVSRPYWRLLLLNAVLYWAAVGGLLFLGIVALFRPGTVLSVRHRFGPLQNVDGLRGILASRYGSGLIRLFGVGLLIVGVALIHDSVA
jgi:hypothetical protein